MASNGTYKGTNAFTDTIRQYLENKAKNDSLFHQVRQSLKIG